MNNSQVKHREPKDLAINREQGLFVLYSNEPFTSSCLGFEVCRKQIADRFDWLCSSTYFDGVVVNGFVFNRTIAKHMYPADKITGMGDHELRGMFALHEAVNHQCQLLCRQKNVRCSSDLNPALIGLEDKWVNVIDKFGDEHVFKVGKSTGWCPIHLAIEKAGDDGGGSAPPFPYSFIKIISQAEGMRLRKSSGGKRKDE